MRAGTVHLASLFLIAASHAAHVWSTAPRAPPPIFAWQGFYLGAQAGYGWSSFQNGGDGLLDSPSGGLIGVTGGYNFMVAPQFLLGAEADFAFSGMSQAQSPFFGVFTRGEVDDLLTVRARAGVTMDRALLYVTGGFAGSKVLIGVKQHLHPLLGRASDISAGLGARGRRGIHADP